MSPTCLYLPILDGQTPATRDFLAELCGARADAYAESQRALEVSKEAWFIAKSGEDDILVAYLESVDFSTALSRMSASSRPFDRWFKDRLRTCTGLDLDNPPAIELPELAAYYTES
ncbi:hypothetical protein M2272_003360 [Mycobacterium frederiksbergense]|uniref:Uncharacterized protein n=1 Tax=Mycolicibacterium frederiksbergense TaxID=117567 RepID=A0ABT6L179_9MYCO|nr:hypothetical protein [Mycolicibacterium frederiksbergense]MDH6196707.1 hypothetical protein [Mycolicibacterium frederiksbergense]